MRRSVGRAVGAAAEVRRVAVVRDYERGDAVPICRQFYETVRTVNLGDYSPEQVRAWAPEVPDPDAWHGRMSGRHTLGRG